MARRWMAFATVTALGCGGGNYVLLQNGGVEVPAGACADVTISPEMTIVAPRAADCDSRQGYTLAPHATAAFWRVGGSPWAGPVIAEAAMVEVASEHPLEANASDKGLVSGSSEKGLQSGASASGLQSGASDKGLQSGASASGLQSGASDKGLQSGASGRATSEKPARFVLTVTNVSDVDLSAVTVVDRVDASLRVAGVAGTALPDRSTVVVFRSDQPLPARSSRAFVLEVYAR